MLELSKAPCLQRKGEKATYTNTPRRLVYDEKARWRFAQNRQGALSTTRRRDGDLCKFAKAPYLRRERVKATCTNSPRHLVSDKKAIRRLIRSRQGALFKTRRREGALYKLAKVPYFGQEGEKATCTNSPRHQEGDKATYSISPSRLIQVEKARRRLVQTRQGTLFQTRRR